ncbi:hypothetical protein A3J23_03810 [Candidatus Peregrinibacteria bacterium RIFCSPLOWO2_02_FULL_48_14]|nr:MAG: hypothetical protein A3J23_03810 [Candidatus Peregrinibacteria bacterium RIFCSPLOWO2_02_FULL_48_14]
MFFFDELQKLRESVPHPCILTVNSENSDYCPYHGAGKNCYLLIGHMGSEDCMYGFWLGDSKDCIDCAFTEKSELAYECVDVRGCYSCDYCQDCLNSSFCEFSYDLKGCESCFGCINLRNKSFCIFNVQYDKETYKQKTAELRTRYYKGDRREFDELLEREPHVYLQGFQNENVVGDHIFNSRNCYSCFDVNSIEDCYYMFNAYTVKDCMDTVYTNTNSELNYFCQSAVNLRDSNFCNVCWYSQGLEYCEYVFNSHDCFGCVGRNHAQYEILNKSYPKEEYFRRVMEIKEQMKAEGTYGRWWWETPYPELEPSPAYMALQYY